MRKLLFVFILTSFFSVSCKPEKEHVEVPERLVPVETMVEMIYEIQLIEADYRGRAHDDTLARPQMETRLIETLKKYNVNDSDFKASFDYYSYSPKIMEEIYADVLTKLNTRLTEEEGKVD